jgi:hypothetical protein
MDKACQLSVPTRTQHINWRPIFKLKIGQAKVCNLSFAITFLVSFPHKTTQNKRPFSQPSRALPRRLNCRGLRSPHPPRPRIAAAARRLPPHRLPPVAAVVAAVSPSSPPSPPALVLPCTTTSPRRRLPNCAVSVVFYEWTRCRVTRSIFGILAMEARGGTTSIPER